MHSVFIDFLHSKGTLLESGLHMMYVGQCVYSEEQGYSLIRQCMSWE